MKADEQKGDCGGRSERAHADARYFLRLDAVFFATGATFPTPRPMRDGWVARDSMRLLSAAAAVADAADAEAELAAELDADSPEDLLKGVASGLCVEFGVDFESRVGFESLEDFESPEDFESLDDFASLAGVASGFDSLAFFSASEPDL